MGKKELIKLIENAVGITSKFVNIINMEDEFTFLKGEIYTIKLVNDIP